MNESKWTREICGELHRNNAMVHAIVGTMMQAAGWPDRYVAHTLWQGYLEFKGEKTELKKHQAIILRELNKRRPGLAYVVRYPNRIEDYNGNLVKRFHGTGADLLHTLNEITPAAENEMRFLLKKWALAAKVSHINAQAERTLVKCCFACNAPATMIRDGLCLECESMYSLVLKKVT